MEREPAAYLPHHSQQSGLATRVVGALPFPLHTDVVVCGSASLRHHIVLHVFSQTRRASGSWRSSSRPPTRRASWTSCWAEGPRRRRKPRGSRQSETERETHRTARACITQRTTHCTRTAQGPAGMRWMLDAQPSLRPPISSRPVWAYLLLHLTSPVLFFSLRSVAQTVAPLSPQLYTPFSVLRHGGHALSRRFLLLQPCPERP